MNPIEEDTQPPTEDEIDSTGFRYFLSAAGIKAVFDIVRNFGIASLFLYGADLFQRWVSRSHWSQADRRANEVLVVTLTLIGLALFFLNVLLVTHEVRKAKFFALRSDKWLWEALV